MTEHFELARAWENRMKHSIEDGIFGTGFQFSPIYGQYRAPEQQDDSVLQEQGPIIQPNRVTVDTSNRLYSSPAPPNEK